MEASLRTSKEVINQIKNWAASNKVVRAVILTSSRTKPDAEVDALSDYDLELYVSDLHPFTQNDEWLNVFGPVLISWPYTPRSTSFDDKFVTRLVLFRDFVRVDFQICGKAT